MLARIRSMLALFALMVVSSSGWAATFNVAVGGTAGNVFTPKDLTINVGDTVTWTNAGGFHNVAADNGSFRNGNPSGSTWTFSETFSSAGTIGYSCEIHASSGMTGTITVNATTPSIKLGGYLSGNWFDPSPNQSGHGFQFEFTAQSNILIAIWFVFTPDGSGPQWVYGQGMFDPNSSTVTIPAAVYSGAKFPPQFNSNDNQQALWGNLTFTFSDCNHGTASWSSIVPGYGSGSIPIQRITSIEGTACPP